MRVLHVIPSLSPADGGTSQAALGMCHHLRAVAGVAAEIATTRVNVAGERSEPAVDEVPVHWLTRSCSRAWKYSRSLGTWLDSHAGEYDLVHAHAVFTYSTLAARRAAAASGIPLVITPHGMLAPYSLGRKRLRKFWYWHLVEKRNLVAASCVHATAPTEQDEIARLVPGCRTVCVSLGVDPAAWEIPKVRGVFRRRFGIPEEAPLLLYLSRIHSKKGLADVLLPALARLPSGVHLAVVGEADASEPEQGALARAVAKRLGLARRVTFTGPIYGDEKWAAYDDADLYVLPSVHENFGITTIEAMARGLPCVVSPGVQCAPFVGRAQAGRIVPRDAAALASALNCLLEAPPAERQEMGRRGQEFVARELTWSQTARRLAELYHDLLQSRGTSPAVQPSLNQPCDSSR